MARRSDVSWSASEHVDVKLAPNVGKEYHVLFCDHHQGVLSPHEQKVFCVQRLTEDVSEKEASTLLTQSDGNVEAALSALPKTKFCAPIFGPIKLLEEVDHQPKFVDDTGKNALPEVTSAWASSYLTHSSFGEKRQKVGIGLSGGGTRAASAGLGQLRALCNLHVKMDNTTMPAMRMVGYLSAVSGGGWVAIPFTFLKSNELPILLYAMLHLARIEQMFQRANYSIASLPLSVCTELEKEKDGAEAVKLYKQLREGLHRLSTIPTHATADNLHSTYSDLISLAQHLNETLSDERMDTIIKCLKEDFDILQRIVVTMQTLIQDVYINLRFVDGKIEAMQREENARSTQLWIVHLFAYVQKSMDASTTRQELAQRSAQLENEEIHLSTQVPAFQHIGTQEFLGPPMDRSKLLRLRMSDLKNQQDAGSSNTARHYATAIAGFQVDFNAMWKPTFDAINGWLGGMMARMLGYNIPNLPVTFNNPDTDLEQWSRVVGKNFLQLVKLDNVQSFFFTRELFEACRFSRVHALLNSVARDVKTVEKAYLGEAPQHFNEDLFALAHQQRPFLIVNSLIYDKHKPISDDDPIFPVQYTPLYVMVANQACRAKIGSDDEAILLSPEDVSDPSTLHIGGKLMSPFLYDCINPEYLGALVNDHENDLTTHDAQKAFRSLIKLDINFNSSGANRFTLCDIMAATGAAPQRALDNLRCGAHTWTVRGISLMRWLMRIPLPNGFTLQNTQMFPSFFNWDHKRLFAQHPEAAMESNQSTVNHVKLQHTDGGVIENTGLPAMLQRGCSRIVLFVNAGDPVVVPESGHLWWKQSEEMFVTDKGMPGLRPNWKAAAKVEMDAQVPILFTDTIPNSMSSYCTRSCVLDNASAREQADRASLDQITNPNAQKVFHLRQLLRSSPSSMVGVRQGLAAEIARFSQDLETVHQAQKLVQRLNDFHLSDSQSPSDDLLAPLRAWEEAWNDTGKENPTLGQMILHRVLQRTAHLHVEGTLNMESFEKGKRDINDAAAVQCVRSLNKLVTNVQVWMWTTAMLVKWVDADSDKERKKVEEKLLDDLDTPLNRVRLSFASRVTSGEVCAAKVTVLTKSNATFQVEGGKRTRIVFVYNQQAPGFFQTILGSPDVETAVKEALGDAQGTEWRKLARDSTNSLPQRSGELAAMPGFSTFEQIKLSQMQVNMLAAHTEYVVSGLFRESEMNADILTRVAPRARRVLGMNEDIDHDTDLEDYISLKRLLEAW